MNITLPAHAEVGDTLVVQCRATPLGFTKIEDGSAYRILDRADLMLGRVEIRIEVEAEAEGWELYGPRWSMR